MTGEDYRGIVLLSVETQSFSGMTVSFDLGMLSFVAVPHLRAPSSLSE
jgi:hypothetical protein